MIAPAGVSRRTAAARVGAINHVIVNQRGAVEKFDDSGKVYRALAIRTRVTVGEQKERRAQTLPSSAEKVAGDFADRLKGGGALAGKLLFDQNQVVADEVEDFLDGQKRDGLSSRRRVSGVMGAQGLRRPLSRAVKRTFQPTWGGAMPKNRLKLDAVVAAISSGGKFLTFASVFATSAT